MERNVYLELLDPPVARELWLKRIAGANSGLACENVPLRHARGRVLAEPVAAARSSPAFHGAAMDGIAVAARQTFGASPRNPMRLQIGKDAFWVNTGRPLPDGTDAVIMVEQINLEDDGKTAVIEKSAFPWQHVRKTGEDIVATEIILPAGTRIGPYELGALAAAGVFSVPVCKRARVAVIPSGSEISPLETASRADLESGRLLPEFNSLVFCALLEEAGAEAHVLPIVPDDPARIREAVLKAAAEADLIILNAGASAGSHDFSSGVISQCGELLCHGVAMMPGKPTALGLVHADGRLVPILGAPGYPISAIMAVEEFALPLLAFWQKRPPKARQRITARPINPLPSRPGMEERVRVKLGLVDGNYYAVPLPRGAGVISSLSRADAVISIPRDCEGIAAGEAVAATLLRPENAVRNGLLAIGSHDNTLDLLDSLLRRWHGGFRLVSAHVGSLGGLKALKAGQCHLATSHLFDPQTALYNQAAIREHLSDLPVTLVRLAQREQGLIIRPGNPLNIRGFADLARPDVAFINRQRGSGTRVLLDYEIEQAGLSPKDIKGYTSEEYTHMNVAVAVASGRADAGLGNHAAARALGLDFIPVTMEDYDLVIPKKNMNDPRVTALLAVIRSAEFKNAAMALGGYDLGKTGEVIWES